MCSCKPRVSLLLPLTPTGPSGSASQLTSPSASASRPRSPLPLSPGSPAAADGFLRSCGQRAFTHPECPPPGVSGPRSPGRSPEIAHCQIRSSISSSVGASSPSQPSVFLLFSFLPHFPARCPDQLVLLMTTGQGREGSVWARGACWGLRRCLQVLGLGVRVAEYLDSQILPSPGSGSGVCGGAGELTLVSTRGE